MSLKRALVCAPRMLEYDRESGGRRVYDLVSFLREAGWAVSFVAQEATGGERYIRLLQQRGVATYTGSSPLVEHLVATVRFDLAILAYWQLAESYIRIIRRISPTTRVVVDMIDLHFLRNARRIFRNLAEDQPASQLDPGYASEMIREVNTYSAADGVLAVSQKEADLINDMIGDSALAYVVPDNEDLARSTVPFTQRRGILFLGNFWHRPNVEAAEYLCGDILPRVDPRVLAQHPVYIVGNQMNETVLSYTRGVPYVRPVGWVPSLLPYLEAARISVIPLLHGAGTKRKLIQALMMGTPTVSTRIGIEGLNLQDGEHVLVADEPEAFASAITRLLGDAELWQHLAHHGQAHIRAAHGRETARGRLLHALSAILASEAKPEVLVDSKLQIPQTNLEYKRLVERIRDVVQIALPQNATVIVVSKGDNDLLKLGDRRAWHFPQTEKGVYAGSYPANGAAAISHLEGLRAKGGDFLLFPATAYWWLHHYADLARHLESHYRVVVRQEESCLIFALREGAGKEGQAYGATIPSTRELATASSSRDLVPSHKTLAGLRPVISEIVTGRRFRHSVPRQPILILGIYLADQPNNVQDIVSTLSETRSYEVTQRWVALGGKPPKNAIAGVSVEALADRKPKFHIINDLLAKEDVNRYEYVLIVDDDIVLPHQFIDYFLSLQESLGFALAQPARTSNSNIDHPIVEQQRGALARETCFVEIGPVVSIHKSAYDVVFPFDPISPMGWGYENVWAYRLAQRNRKMGIIDAVPVDHSLRPPLTNYSWGKSDKQRTELFKRHRHLSYDECFRVLDVFPLEQQAGSRRGDPRAGVRPHLTPTGAAEPSLNADAPAQPPVLSVIIPTHNREALLICALESLAGQSVAPDEYEVIIVDDGSTDGSEEMCRSFSSEMRLRYFRIAHAGISAAKNVGVFAAQGPLVLFFDDDDIATKDLLREHLKMHERFPEEQMAVLGYTTWAPSLQVTEVMDYVTNGGGFLFSYGDITNGQVLDFTYFWGGCVSCKRSLLIREGVFRQEFQFGSEDIELGYRLSRCGLKVVFNRDAVQYMNRPITYDEFCRRCERQGRSQVHFSRAHPDPVIQQYCQVNGAEEHWGNLKQALAENVRRVHALERQLASRVNSGDRDPLLGELRSLYSWTFKAFKIKGIVEAVHCARGEKSYDEAPIAGAGRR